MKSLSINIHMILMFFIFSTFSSVLAQVDNEMKLFVDIKLQIQQKNFNQAEKKLDTLLTDYSHSARIEKYYFTKNDLYQQMLKESKTDQQNEATRSNSHGKGTILIRLGEKYDGEKAELEEKRIINWEQYLQKVPNGNNRETVLLSLMMIYTTEDSDKIINIANELTKSRDNEKVKYAFFYKALIAHFNNRYENSITQYKKAIEFSIDNGEKAKFQLYMSDCYYNLGKDDLAINSLEQVEDFEKDLENKYMSKMAKIWKKYYEEEFQKSLDERKQLVFFE